jgi:hypothetical protein
VRSSESPYDALHRTLAWTPPPLGFIRLVRFIRERREQLIHTGRTPGEGSGSRSYGCLLKDRAWRRIRLTGALKNRPPRGKRQPAVANAPRPFCRAAGTAETTALKYRYADASVTRPPPEGDLDRADGASRGQRRVERERIRRDHDGETASGCEPAPPIGHESGDGLRSIGPF